MTARPMASTRNKSVVNAAPQVRRKRTNETGTRASHNGTLERNIVGPQRRARGGQARRKTRTTRAPACEPAMNLERHRAEQRARKRSRVRVTKRVTSLATPAPASLPSSAKAGRNRRKSKSSVSNRTKRTANIDPILTRQPRAASSPRVGKQSTRLGWCVATFSDPDRAVFHRFSLPPSRLAAIVYFYLFFFLSLSLPICFVFPSHKRSVALSASPLDCFPYSPVACTCSDLPAAATTRMRKEGN